MNAKPRQLMKGLRRTAGNSVYLLPPPLHTRTASFFQLGIFAMPANSRKLKEKMRLSRLSFVSQPKE